jgi:glycosyltransferase involved in cell wall biosynthesis
MPNWVDLRRFENLPDKATIRAELGWPSNRRVILFLHRVVERKGAHLIVPIAQEVIARSEGKLQFTLVVAGSGPYEATLSKDIEAAGLRDTVRLVGGVPNRDAIRYFAAADVYMVPSTEEGFPRTLLEAMAAGCPFATTDVGGVPDILKPPQTECMVPVGDVAGMAEVIIRILSDDHWRQELIATGRQVVQGYSEEEVVGQFLTMVTANG